MNTSIGEVAKCSIVVSVLDGQLRGWGLTYLPGLKFGLRCWLHLLPSQHRPYTTGGKMRRRALATYSNMPKLKRQSCQHFIHSFIHSGDLYSASSRGYYSEALPAQPRTKKKVCLNSLDPEHPGIMGDKLYHV